MLPEGVRVSSSLWSTLARLRFCEDRPPCGFEIGCARAGRVKDETDGGLSLAGGRNKDDLKGAQWKEEVESLSVGANEPGTRVDGAFMPAMSCGNVVG